MVASLPKRVRWTIKRGEDGAAVGILAPLQGATKFREPQEGEQSRGNIYLNNFKQLNSIEAWRSLVARLLWEQDAAGSNPVASTITEPID